MTSTTQGRSHTNAQSVAIGSEAQVAKAPSSEEKQWDALNVIEGSIGREAIQVPPKSSPELVDRQGAVQHFWIFVWGMGIFNVRKHIGLIGGGGGQKVAASVFI